MGPLHVILAINRALIMMAIGGLFTVGLVLISPLVLVEALLLRFDRDK